MRLPSARRCTRDVRLATGWPVVRTLSIAIRLARSAPHQYHNALSIVAAGRLGAPPIARRHVMTAWEIKGREFGNCNCDYSCPCQFNALPSNGHCRGLAVYDIEQGFHGTTRLD